MKSLVLDDTGGGGNAMRGISYALIDQVTERRIADLSETILRRSRKPSFHGREYLPEHLAAYSAFLNGAIRFLEETGHGAQLGFVVFGERNVSELREDGLRKLNQFLEYYEIRFGKKRRRVMETYYLDACLSFMEISPYFDMSQVSQLLLAETSMPIGGCRGLLSMAVFSRAWIRARSVHPGLGRDCTLSSAVEFPSNFRVEVVLARKSPVLQLVDVVANFGMAALKSALKEERRETVSATMRSKTDLFLSVFDAAPPSGLSSLGFSLQGDSLSGTPLATIRFQAIPGE